MSVTRYIARLQYEGSYSVLRTVEEQCEQILSHMEERDAVRIAKTANRADDSKLASHKSKFL